MNNAIFKKFLPHLIAMATFLLVMAMFYKPVVIDGLTLPQHDVQQAHGMQNEIRKHLPKDGEIIQWTNACFAGMPTYQIMASATNNYASKFGYVTSFGNGILKIEWLLFVSMLLAFWGLLMLGVDWKLALVGALAYGLTTFNVVLAEAGHSTKVYAIAVAAPLFGSAIMALRGKWLIGGGLFAFFTAVEIYANHLQMTYYIFLLLGIYGLIELGYALKENRLKGFLMGALALTLGLGIGVLSNLNRLWTTQEYASESIRGGSVLKDTNNKNKGLSPSYVFEYSSAPRDMFTYIFPDFVGGTVRNAFISKEGSASAEAVQNIAAQNGGQKVYEQLAQATAQYWGGKPFTTGPVYFGAIICFLFILALFVLDNSIRWWAIVSVVFFTLLSFGSYLPAFNTPMYDYFPFYKKFRDVTSTLDILQVLVVMVAMLGLFEFLKKNYTNAKRLDALKKAGYVTLGIVAMGLLYSVAGALEGKIDENLNKSGLNELVTALKADRAALIRSEILRTVFFIALAFGLLWLYTKEKLTSLNLVIAIGLLSTVDLWLVDKRYVNDDSFVESASSKTEVTPENVDKLIYQTEKDAHYRVLDLLRDPNPLAGANSCYLHKSLSGYHGAKLALYQDFASVYVINQDSGKYTFPEYMKLLGMLNVKYIINNKDQPIPVPTALGNAWFVDSIQVVKTPQEEHAALAQLNPSNTALMLESELPENVQKTTAHDSLAKIKLTSYHPENMVYQYSTTAPKLAMFSEVYYSKGWNLYLDGQPMAASSIHKANYLLRSAWLPAGNHKLEMKFEPQSFILGRKLALIGSILIYLLLFASLYFAFKSTNEKQLEYDI